MNKQLVACVLFSFLGYLRIKENPSFNNIMISITFRRLKMQLATKKKSIFTTFVQITK